MRRKQKPEAGLQAAIMGLFLAERVAAIRVNCGVLPDRTGRPVSFARWMDGTPATGFPDLMIVDAGRVAFMELKAPQGTSRASQIEFRRWAEAAGAEYLVVRDFERAREWLATRSSSK